jgi:pyruvate/2-oxoglutarate/acetoin dehydrogenase E1 component
MRKITYIEAVREATREEFQRDETIFMFGEGIGERGGAWTQTKGMYPEFGRKRLIDTPLSEPGFIALAVGAAMTGLRPIVDMMFWDFANDAYGQIFNQAARIHYISNGQYHVPITIIGSCGLAGGSGGHHSSRSYPAYANMPGLKIVLPSTPYDIKGLLKTAIRDDDPVLIFQHRALHNFKGEVPEEEYLIPFGQADVKRQGTDVTVVATLRMLHLALKAAEALEKEDVSVEVVDPRTLFPLDKETILASVRKTGRLVVVDEAFEPFGLGGEMAALAADEAFYYLDSPIKRIHPVFSPEPMTPPLEQAWLPGEARIVAGIREVMNQ